MRVTQLLTYNGLQRHLNRNREELARFQEQLSSGQRVFRPSDDNIAFTTSRLLKNSINKNEQYQRNINTGLSHARSTQEALDGMLDLLIQFKSIGIKASSDSLSSSDREILANQVGGLKKKIVDFANSKFNNTYLFGGTKTGEAPFSENAAATGGVDDTSTNRPLKAAISDSTTVETTVTGVELRNTAAGDLFGIMQDAEDALRNNDRAAVSGLLNDMEATVDHVNGLASRTGNTINRLDFVLGQLKSWTIEEKGEVSRLIDADYAEVITNFKKYETAYEAALNVHARISQTTLLNYI